MSPLMREEVDELRRHLRTVHDVIDDWHFELESIDTTDLPAQFCEVRRSGMEMAESFCKLFNQIDAVMRRIAASEKIQPRHPTPKLSISRVFIWAFLITTVLALLFQAVMP